VDNLIRLILKNFEEKIDKKDIGYYFFGRPQIISKDVAQRGVICVKPISTSIQSISTGLIDRDTYTIQVIVAKNVQPEFYKNAQEESGDQFMTRVIEGRKSCGNLNERCVRYVIREHLKKWGILQPNLTIQYDTNAFRE
jgi:hypothetical protein